MFIIKKIYSILIINWQKPDVIIHCAAEKRVEVVEANFEKANDINMNATEHLSKLSGWFIQSVKKEIIFIEYT